MRIFAGLPIPAEMMQKVSLVCQYLKETYNGLNVVKTEGLHVTLHFFGELNKHTVEELIQLMNDQTIHQKKIEVTFSGFSQFPPRGNPRVIYIKIEKGKEEITAYYKRFMKLIQTNGFDTQETKKFVPHITIARNKRERLPGDYRSFIPFTMDDSFTIDRCVLFQSTLTPNGAEYNAMKTELFI